MWGHGVRVGSERVYQRGAQHSAIRRIAALFFYRLYIFIFIFIFLVEHWLTAAAKGSPASSLGLGVSPGRS
jgi:hypothetical protein